jgi:diguanylate cyclase (GGDEF)-like protein/hemerythrin-like metal-binding protein
MTLTNSSAMQGMAALIAPGLRPNEPRGSQTIVSGLTMSSALRVFSEFPMPLALLHPDGHVDLTNTRFDESIDRGCLDSEPLHDVAVHPGRPWQLVQLPGRHGGVIAARAQAMRMSNRTLLALDTAPDARGADEITQLKGRILELEWSSSRDHLTGVWNRAHLDQTIEFELSRSVRYQQPLSLVLIDVDHFKRVNDVKGHQAGDQVLRDLARVLGAHIRTADLLFRWGGEEFVVLMSASGYRAAERLANHLRDVVERHTFEDIGPVTISLGVAEHSDMESSEAWFGRLDKALYDAKHLGRNQVVVDRRGTSDEWLTGKRSPTLRVVWQEGYECGQPLIDGQHRHLFELANDLLDAALTHDAAPAAFEVALDRLLTHVAGHFVDEEALLAAKGYQHLSAHKKAHADLLARARLLRAQAATGAFKLGDLVEYLVNDVVTKHMLTVDREFFPLFASPADSSKDLTVA